MSQTKAQLIDGKSAEIEFTGGSASGPAISFTGDTNTGIYSPGADQVAVATNGTGRVFVDASGNVGVGTSSPNSDLHILSGNPRVNLQSSGASSTADYFLLCRKADNTAYSVNVKATGESLTFGTGGNPGNSYVPSERLRITSAGLVGIGTSSPTLKLSVDGDTWFGNGAGAEIGRLFNDSGVLHLRGSANVTGLALGTNNTRAVTIDSSQRVGIGTTSPAAPLDVNGAIYSRSTGVYTDAITAYGGSSLAVNAGSSNLNITVNASERARIDSSGRLLVGTSTDTTAKLVVKGSAGSGDDGINVISGSTTAGSKAAIFFSPSSTGSSSTGSAIKTERLSPDGSDLQFYTCTALGSSPTERMRITSLGVPRFFSSDTGIISKVAAVAGTAETLFRGSHTATNVLNGTDCIFIRANGNVENTNNSYGAISDIKLKENIVDASPQWDDLKALQVRNYNFKEGQTHTQIGLVAQEVELVSPGLVSESPDRDEEGNDLGTVTKSVNYSVLYMKAVKALQEAMERIETLEQRLNDAGIN